MKALIVSPHTVGYWEHQRYSKELYEKAVDELVNPECPEAIIDKITRYSAGDLSLYMHEPNYGWRNVPPIVLFPAPSGVEEHFLLYNGHTRRHTASRAGLSHIGALLVENEDDFQRIKESDEYYPPLASVADDTLNLHLQELCELYRDALVKFDYELV